MNEDVTPKADLCSEIPCAEYRDSLECRIQDYESEIRRLKEQTKEDVYVMGEISKARDLIVLQVSQDKDKFYDLSIRCSDLHGALQVAVEGLAELSEPTSNQIHAFWEGARMLEVVEGRFGAWRKKIPGNGRPHSDFCKCGRALETEEWRATEKLKLKPECHHKAVTPGCDCGGDALDNSGKTHKSWCASRDRVNPNCNCSPAELGPCPTHGYSNPKCDAVKRKDQGGI